MTTAQEISPIRHGSGGVITEQLDDLPTETSILGVDPSGKHVLLTGDDLPEGPQGEPGADGIGTAESVGTLLVGLTSITTPADTDLIGVSDSAASNVWKKLTWANLKAALKTFFDTLYQPANSFLTTLAGINATSGTGAIALVDSPALAGNPTAPTQSVGNNSTRLATTAFVTAGFIPLATSTANRIPKRSGTTGALTDSGITIDASNNVTGVAALTASGAITNTISGNSTFTTAANAVNIFAGASAAERVTITKDGTFSYVTASGYYGNTGGSFFGFLANNRTLGAAGLQLISTDRIAFTNSTSFGTVTTTLSQSSAGVLQVGSGTSNGLNGSLLLTNLTASGSISVGPITKTALLLLTPSATAGEWRVTDSTPAQRRVYPDGTNWRYLSDDSIVT